MKNIFYLTIILLFASCSSSKDLKIDNANLTKEIEYNKATVTKLTYENENLAAEIETFKKSKKEINARLTKCNSKLTKVSSTYDTYNSKIKTMRKELESAFPNNLNDVNFAIVEEDGRLIIRLPNRILYRSGSADFNSDGLAVIQKLSKIFKGREGLNLLIEGHTDDIPLRSGSIYEDNWDLSLARAVKIVRQFESYGVHPQRLTAAGRANFAPVDRTVSEEARAKNRRTEIIIRPKLTELLRTLSEIE